MDWQTVLALSVNAAATAAVVYLCLPRNRRRVSVVWFGLTAFGGILAGLACLRPPPLFSNRDLDSFPFDPRDHTGALFGDYILWEDFTVGLGIPFIVLALVLAVRKPKQV